MMRIKKEEYSFRVTALAVKQPTVTDYIRLVLSSKKGLFTAKPINANLYQYA